MKKLLILLLLVPSSTFAAVTPPVYDTSSDTTSITLAGGEQFIACGTFNTGGDTTTLISVGGNPLTKITSRERIDNNDRFVSVWGLQHTMSGSQTITYTGTDALHACVNYTNAEVVQPDAYGSDTANTSSLSMMLTSVTDNSLQIGFFANQNETTEAGAETTQVIDTGAGTGWYVADAPTSPAGAGSIIYVTSGAADNLVGISLMVRGAGEADPPATTTPPVATSTSTPDQVQQNLFNGVLIFFISFFGVVWLFRKSH